MVRLNNSFFPVVELEMIPGLESNKSSLNFTWVCVDFQPLYMDFNINYTHFNAVSIFEAKDSLKVNFFGKQFFRA